jgi:hypothetical protein
MRDFNESDRKSDGTPEVVDTIIIMPEARRQTIANKLAEYEARLIQHETEASINKLIGDGLKARDGGMVGKIPNQWIGTIYKIALARALLADGQVNTFALSSRLQEEHGGLNPGRFKKAASELESYCQGRRSAE